MTGDLKGDIINDAFSQLRISGLTLHASAEDVALALSRLENMVAEWESSNIGLGYTFEDEPSANTPHNIPRWAWHGVAASLALRLVVDFGKEPSQMLLAQASQGASSICARTSIVRPVQAPTRMPLGRGNRWNRHIKYYHPADQAPPSAKTVRMFVDDINDFVEHFDSFLVSPEDISTYTIEATDGLTIVSNSLTSPDIFYRIKAIGAADESQNSLQTVTIKVTTTLGRVQTRKIYFQVEA